MTKAMRRMLFWVFILFGSIFAYKFFTQMMMKNYLAHQSHVVTVSAMKIIATSWQSEIKVVGSLRAIRGVNVTTEVAGMVQNINFTPGMWAKEGDLLVQLNADTDLATLNALIANEELAESTYKRDKAQYAVSAISKQSLEVSAANLKNLKAQVAAQTALVAKKTIRAPFSGKLGINLVNPGQYVAPGTELVMLQTKNPLYADFFVPQQDLEQLAVGIPVTINSDTFPKQVFTGQITTINPGIDPETRNVEVEATIENPKDLLAPGMFVTVVLKVGAEKSLLTLPQTAISFNPYGEIVYVINQAGHDEKNHPILKVKQAFVKTGQRRGDQISILKGLKTGDLIVTSGQLKLKNETQVIIDNSLQPENNQEPNPPNEH